ncbi:MAG: MATE family efflux transporter [Candidatus Methanomethylophilaceae archaeon]|nr:MATE family efflux transporter [Candidatus Methanomethylophilaceae archaeon]
MSDGSSIDLMLGDPKKALRGMLFPLIVSYMVVQINLLADTIWCSGLGSDASSAVSAMSPLYWIISDIGTGLGVGASVSIARSIGAGDRERANELCRQMAIFSIFASAVVTVILLMILKPGIHLIGADDVGQGCVDYMMPMILCSVFIIMDGVFAGLIRAEGAAKRVMILLMSVSVINMILDPILIYVFDMGLMGAGLATVLGSLGSALLAISWYARRQLNLTISLSGYRPRLPYIGDMLYVGIPRISESMIVNVMSFIQRIFVIMCAGTVGVTIFNIPWRYVAIGIVPALAISAAMVPICSAALGRNDMGKAKTGFRYAVSLSLKVLIPISLAIFILADLLVIPFTLSPSMMELRPQFVETLRIYAFIIPFFGMIEVGSAILQSLRMAQFAMLLSFLRNLLICIFFLFAYHYTMTVISLSLLVAEIIGGLGMIGIAYFAIRRREKTYHISARS